MARVEYAPPARGQETPRAEWGRDLRLTCIDRRKLNIGHISGAGRGNGATARFARTYSTQLKPLHAVVYRLAPAFESRPDGSTLTGWESELEACTQAGALHMATRTLSGAMVMKSKLTSAAIAATIFVFSSVVTAEQPAEQDPAKNSQETTKKRTTKGEKPKDTKAGQKGKEGSVSEKVKEGVREEEKSAKKMQEEIVGKEQQEENERKARQARDAREREERDRREAQEAGEAVGRATTTAATTVIEAGQDVTRALDQPGKYNPVAATWNPLGAIVGGRISFNVEYAPVTHHVIIASPHFANPSQEVSVGPDVQRTNRFTGVGGELGYRYYTGTRGMNGIFIGPSIIGGVYNASLIQGDTAFTNIGVAADIGVQQVFWDHLALGAGAGIEYLSVSQEFGDLPAGASTIASSGLKPRLLAQAGYAF